MPDKGTHIVFEGNTDADDDILVRVEDVHKSFGSKEVLQGISFDVKEREVVAVIGTSGCGKSTLLRIIAGLESVDSGQVYLGDPNYTMVFQYSALFDSLNVFENVAFSLLEEPDFAPTGKEGGPRPSHMPDPSTMGEFEMRELVREKLNKVGLGNIMHMYPNELSGGMRKRVSFARAIVSNPKIILYDEPTAGLDPVASKTLEEYILQLRDDLGAASIVVTHEFHTIFRTADRICLLDQGKIQWLGRPDEFFKTDNPKVQEFASAGVVPELSTYAGDDHSGGNV